MDSAFGAAPFGGLGPADTGTIAVTRPTIANAPLIVDGDTVRDAAGNLVDAPDPIDQEVAFFLTTVAGSFFGDPSVGNGVIRVRVMRPRSLVETSDHARRALAPMVDRGDIEAVAVTPAPVAFGGLARNFYTVNYRKTGAVRR